MMVVFILLKMTAGFVCNKSFSLVKIIFRGLPPLKTFFSAGETKYYNKSVCIESVMK